MSLKRKVIDELIRWKTEEQNIPVLLKGAKGVGKTFLAYDYAKAFFKHIYYVNFEREPRLTELFQNRGGEDFSHRLMDYFQIEDEQPKEERILILDEISFSRNALIAVQERQLQPVFTYVIIISSHPLPEELGQNYHSIGIHPLEFDEFLRSSYARFKALHQPVIRNCSRRYFTDYWCCFTGCYAAISVFACNVNIGRPQFSNPLF